MAAGNPPPERSGSVGFCSIAFAGTGISLGIGDLAACQDGSSASCATAWIKGPVFVPDVCSMVGRRVAGLHAGSSSVGAGAVVGNEGNKTGFGVGAIGGGAMVGMVVKLGFVATGDVGATGLVIGGVENDVAGGGKVTGPGAGDAAPVAAPVGRGPATAAVGGTPVSGMAPGVAPVWTIQFGEACGYCPWGARGFAPGTLLPQPYQLNAGLPAMFGGAAPVPLGPAMTG